tara:strand:- start:212 stop:511 length:300 start_codon:yes stop_codon:yes gene_type:complete
VVAVEDPHISFQLLLLQEVVVVDQQIIITHQVRPLQIKVLRVELLLETPMVMVLEVAAVQLMWEIMVVLLLLVLAELVYLYQLQELQLLMLVEVAAVNG